MPRLFKHVESTVRKQMRAHLASVSQDDNHVPRILPVFCAMTSKQKQNNVTSRSVTGFLASFPCGYHDSFPEGAIPVLTFQNSCTQLKLQFVSLRPDLSIFVDAAMFALDKQQANAAHAVLPSSASDSEILREDTVCDPLLLTSTRAAETAAASDMMRSRATDDTC